MGARARDGGSVEAAPNASEAVPSKTAWCCYGATTRQGCPSLPRGGCLCAAVFGGNLPCCSLSRMSRMCCAPSLSRRATEIDPSLSVEDVHDRMRQDA